MNIYVYRPWKTCHHCIYCEICGEDGYNESHRFGTVSHAQICDLVIALNWTVYMTTMYNNNIGMEFKLSKD